ncbi:ferredoxin [Streptomyces sp. NPDC048514]|uniref:ferredoxin n=1 Tax=Streptomyces sp. NPDC048514 TaxID=3365564 RepID=UPI003719428D
MKLSVDLARCEGHGLCEEAAPELFRLDDEGDLVVLFDASAAVPAEHETDAASAARVCPIGALRVRSE